MAAGAPPFVLGTLSSEPSGPVPTNATFFTASNTVTVEFNENLAPQLTLDPAQWAACGGANSLIMAAGNAFINTVTLSVVPLGGACGAPRVTYTGNDPLLTSAVGVPVPAFSDFPMTVV